MNRPPRENHERRILRLAFLYPIPALAVAVALLFNGNYSSRARWILVALMIVSWIGGAFALKERVVRALQSITNLVSALRDGDFSVRGRVGPRPDAFDETIAQVNGLAATLASQRVGALESSALLSKLLAEIDIAIFAFDRQRRLRLVNRAGEHLVGKSSPQVLGTSANGLGIKGFLEGEVPRTVEMAFPGGTGPWELRRGTFRLGGLPHDLVVLTDVKRALREEERQAWRRLIRVLGHEINNSLTPIRAIAEDLQEILRRTGASTDWREDVSRGLAVVARRSEALERFMTSYARLARMPPPHFAPVDVGALVRRVIEIEKRVPIALAPGPDLMLVGDADQLDQILINLVRNAADAVLETGGRVEVSWRALPRDVEIVVADEGPGIADTHNLFVPFFTTKPGGSGIGLALSREIAEAHRGSLSLESRTDRTGALARLRVRRA